MPSSMKCLVRHGIRIRHQALHGAIQLITFVYGYTDGLLLYACVYNYVNIKVIFAVFVPVYFVELHSHIHEYERS